MKITLSILLTVLVAGLFMFNGCSALGSKSSKQDIERYSKSKQFNVETAKFQNRRPHLIKEMQKKMSIVKSLKEWISNPNESVPLAKLPEISPDLNDFMKESSSLKVIWFGHSSLLLNVEGKIILIDPVFSKAASPVSFMVKRFQKPVMEMNELPEVDYILISHDHYDHLDMESIKFFVDKKATFVVPLGIGKHIAGWGVSIGRIVEKDWWEEVSFDGVKFTATPAQHFSGRRGMDGNDSLWASWVITSRNYNIYYSGDSGYDIHFKQIGERLGPFDVAFLESGQYNEKWPEVHMHPDEAAMAYIDLKAKKYFPVHWGMFELSLHSWNDPILRLYRMSNERRINLIAPKIGEVVNIREYNMINKWWDQAHIEKELGSTERSGSLIHF